MCYRSRLIAILLLGLTGLVSASGTKFWQLDSYQDFSAGKSRGLSVTHDGRLVLAPEFSMVFDSGQPYILSATRDKAGNAYFGTGHEGKVYRLDASGKTSVILDVDEADIFALATDSDGNLYAAASPGGKIYRVQPDGSSSVYVDLGVRYVWSLVSDGQGHLYAGTGVEGKIYRITTGQAELFADLPQMHVLSLTMDLDGNLVAGTAPNGYVIRLNPDGRATSLFDAPHKEIHQLYVDRYGNIYALGIGKETAEDTANATESVEATVSIFAAATAKTTKKKSSQSGSIQTLDAGQQNKKSICALYRIDKSLNVLPLWYSNTVTAYSFYVDADGTAYLGTDEQGRIFSIKEDRFLANLVESGQEQVTVMLRDRQGMLACTSNLGKVYRLGDRREKRGEYLSAVADTDIIASLGIVRAVVSGEGAGNGYNFFVRTGNTEEPDSTWSDWIGPMNDSAGWTIKSTPARYFQVRIVISASDEAMLKPDSAGVESVEVSYLQQNQAPRVVAIEVNPPGVTFQQQPVVTSQLGVPDYGEHSSLVLPEYILSRLSAASVKVQRPRVYRPGTRSLSWTAWDPNDDLLAYDISVRRLGTTGWTRLVSGLRDEDFNIGENTLPDGRYFFRVTASDAPSNAATIAREDSLTSKIVVMDTTPPLLKVESAAKTASGIHLQLKATDNLSPIYFAEYSCDGGQSWLPIYPADGINDQLTESYPADLPSLATGVRMLMLRVMDYSGNLAVASTEIK